MINPKLFINKRILILTAGSRGDVQPYVALGIGLKQAGFEVMLATDPGFSSFVTSHALDFAALRAPFAQLIDTDAGKAALAGKKSFSLKQIKPMLHQMMDDAWDVAQQYKPDAVIYHPKPLAGYHIAEKLNVPGFLAMPLPVYSPTRAFFNPVFGGANRGGFLNKLSYTIFLKATLLSYRGLINNWRQEKLGLSKFRDELTLKGRAVPKLYAYSPHVVPVPPDWDETSIVTGYWFLDSNVDWKPPSDLVAFIEQGSAPIYIGFGSMASQDSRRTTRLVLEAVRQSGQRAILATGWGGLSYEEIANNVYILKSAPHDWLFPRCAAVVHHGGAGTTGAGLKAGKPTIICPFFGDQPFWGRRIFELRVGSHPIPQKQLTVEKLAQSIREVITDSEMRQRSEALGEKIRTENGVTQAVKLIKEKLSRHVQL
ncbi:glycosyl transferase family 1 [Dulcicalothrix desertica PCC 7102]|uniref:Glycosyl transferase family 1 n=1 Tax=Dulcicalothrix desertica PCC 7102 TaxID=232991 RepID=A0A3S5K393_9CYAN|nr:glycosyltransferase [Dulcicalothrix desertica]RUT05680.1 glycosyl transferase family 1 [Dulcicalothrix desertica PCC 7102]TWH39655.1 sterol 3beta-glucosyltransferase [Dulcicalothrix desertica PCC 7102]